MNDQEFELMCGYCEDQELTSIWGWISTYGRTYDERVDCFMNVLRRLLVEERIRLINMHTKIPMEGSVEEQLRSYRALFPTSDLEMNDGFWFFSEQCPGGSAWQHR